MAFPLDYVFGGATVVYNANVDPAFWNPSNPSVGIQREGPIANAWYARYFHARNMAGEHYRVMTETGNHIAGSVMFHVQVPGDMRSIDDVRATLDGAVKSAGLKLKASMTRFTSNPRRDGTTQPVVNTPGVPPPVTRIPKEAGNVDNYHDRVGTIEWLLNSSKITLPFFGQVPSLYLIGGLVVAGLVLAKR